MCVLPVHVYAQKPEKKVSDSLELEWQMVVCSQVCARSRTHVCGEASDLLMVEPILRFPVSEL